MTRGGTPPLRSSPTCGTSSATVSGRSSPTGRAIEGDGDGAADLPRARRLAGHRATSRRARARRTTGQRHGAGDAAHPARPGVPPIARRVPARIRRDHARARARLRRRSVRRRRRSRARICGAPAKRRSRATSCTCAKASSKPAAGRRRSPTWSRASAPAFAALLRNVARLNGGALAERAQTPRARARAPPACPTASSTDVLALERPSPIPTTDAARLFPAVPGRRRTAGARRRRVACLTTTTRRSRRKQSLVIVVPSWLVRLSCSFAGSSRRRRSCRRSSRSRSTTSPTSSIRRARPRWTR